MYTYMFMTTYTYVIVYVHVYACIGKGIDASILKVYVHLCIFTIEVCV
jgi:hypothetical protein